MPRRKFQIPRIAWKCRIPEDIAATVDILLMDPLREKSEYGARSELVTQLLREWLDKRRLVGDNIPVINVPEKGNPYD